MVVARRWLCLMTWLLAASCLPCAASADPLAVVSGQWTQTVTLAEGPNGSLGGNLKLVVRNETNSSARVIAHYYPSGDVVPLPRMRSYSRRCGHHSPRPMLWST